ncbi:hypothetical protein ACH5RR_027446 [Cinchona calisaya]|uniref:Uncharacterized protein n=1 Tax=Cinchona calisaya TaxID=153742 RepID=A0ABD2Z6L5_9GENT
MLPGLCKLLETWLMEVVFPRFRETQDIQFKLGDYYDNPTVLKYLERLEGVSGSPLAAAASIAIIGADVTAVLDSVKYGALQALQKVFPLGPSERSVKTDEEYEIINSEVSGESEELTRPNQSDNSTNTGLISDRQKSDDLLEQELITEEIKEASVKIMRAGVAVGLFALFGLKFIPIRNDMPTMVSDVINVEESVDEEDAETSRMDARLVGNLIRTWQNIKSQAVGPDHCLGKLLEILDGEMLKSWTERGAEIAEHGWFWQYTLLNLNIDSFC